MKKSNKSLIREKYRPPIKPIENSSEGTHVFKQRVALSLDEKK